MEHNSKNGGGTASHVHAKDLLDDSLKLIQLEVKRLTEQYDPVEGLTGVEVRALNEFARTLSSIVKNSDDEENELDRLLDLPVDKLEIELQGMVRKLKEPK